MAKIFYDHLIIIEEVVAVLDEHNLPNDKRVELLKLIDQTLHHEILDVILTHLPKEKHEMFLTKFHNTPHDPALMNMLKDHIEIDIEKVILKRANTTKGKLTKSIRRHAVAG
ncbi:hypothetical protein HY948_00840 [Candidatus Gottesmanbacteria bacterium]|nr:hypothetical protein [Candidatus Gottesmanbacteria bacterium]